MCGDLDLTNYAVASYTESTEDTTLLVGGSFKISSNVQLHAGTARIGGTLQTGSGSNFNGGVVYDDSDALNLCMQDAEDIRSTASTLWNLGDEYGCVNLPLSGGGITIDTALKDPSIGDPIAVFCIPARRLQKASTIVINNANGKKGCYGRRPSFCDPEKGLMSWSRISFRRFCADFFQKNEGADETLFRM